MKKYEIVKEQSMIINGHEVFRIRALVDFDEVEEGALGGYVENYENLSQDGKCWLYDNSVAYANSKVFDDARMYNRSIINDHAKLHGGAKLFDDCEVTGTADVYGDAYIFDHSKILGNAVITSGSVHDYSVVSDAIIYEIEATIAGNARILSNTDYMYLKNLGYEQDIASLTIVRTSDNGVRINVDQWSGTLEEFVSELKDMYGDSDTMKEYDLFIQIIKLHFNLS